ncbi:MAG TPA: sn-glycerol-3-phosphate ABC transporter ATP-binding protein UgpC [Gammaproteobacteria bacterium]|nr:sn-glycerol-3-phosphate ABC transporter ATP-binding protein UgpC [Gammaproteobacteria bacterium]
MTEIVLDKVSKQFANGTTAVHEASFKVGDGEFFILVGPSGCGKSTLLNMIVGLDTPSSGEIRIDGRRANEIDARDRNMAMVFQSYALYPHMSVRENLAFPLRVARLPRREIRRRVEEAAAVLELEDVLDRRPAHLSGGQRQRAAMGRAIVREPAAFLLDEPLSNLDARLRVQMRAEIARLQKRLGTTTIYVTHDQVEAMTLGDRVAVLRAGAVQQVGTPRELYRAPANLFVAGFIGSPGMNFLPARLEGERLRLPMMSVELPETVRDAVAAQIAAPNERRSAARLAEETGALIAGLRPEDLREALPGEAGSGAVFRVRADVVEWMGAETYVHFAAGEDVSMVARIGGASEAREDHELDLMFDPADIYLFDAVSGRRIA